MTFLLAMMLATAIPAYHIARTFYRWNNGPGVAPPPFEPYLIPFLGDCFIALGFFVGLFPDAAWRPGSDTNYAPYLIATGGAILLIAGVVLAFRGPTRPNGSWIVCAMAGMLLAYSGIDHIVFFWNKSEAGIMARDLAAEAGVQCAASHLIVKTEGKTYRYRCPTLIQFGNPFGEPFIPWPAYEEGSSEKLATVVEELNARIAKDAAEQQRVLK